MVSTGDDRVETAARWRGLLTVALLATTGCLSGTYDQAYLESTYRYRDESEFQRLHKEPQSLATGRLLLRVPKLFTAQDTAGTKDQSIPPFLQDFPGFQIAHKTYKDAGGAKMAAVLSVGGVLDAESAPEKLKERILNQVRQEKAFAQASWGATDGAGGGNAWSVLKLVGPQPFDRVNNGVTETKSDDGETQVWLASDPDAKVSAILVWRVPGPLAATVPLEELADLVARKVEFLPPAEPAPDGAAAQPAPAAK